MNTPGILLSSGSANPPLTNTKKNYTVRHYTLGDDMFTALAQEAYPGADSTNDASILEFSFQVANPTVKSVSFDLIFGSEEYPEWVDTEFVDIAAVIVNGLNYALFDGDPLKPLSVTGNNMTAGSFYDNDYEKSEYYDEDTGEYLYPYSIEYDGISPRLTVSIPVETGITYDVRIGVADTGDYSFDSGLFITNFRSNHSTAVDGTQVEVSTPDEETGIYKPAAPDTATKFIGGTGENIFEGSTAADTYDITAGTADIIQGTPEQLNGDTVIGFSTKDKLLLLGSNFTKKDIQVTWGSAILDIDTDRDGVFDTTVKLDGTYTYGNFQTEKTDAGTVIKFMIDKIVDGGEFVEAFVNSAGVDLSGFAKSALTSKIQKMVDSHNDQSMTLAAVMGSFPQVRDAVPETVSSLLLYLNNITKSVQDSLDSYITLDVSDLDYHNADAAHFHYKFSFKDGQQFANFSNFSAGDKLDFSSWSNDKPLESSFSSSYATELSYLAGDLDDNTSTWECSFIGLDSDFVSEVLSHDNIVDQMAVVSEVWGNDWLII